MSGTRRGKRQIARYLFLPALMLMMMTVTYFYFTAPTGQETKIIRMSIDDQEKLQR